MGIFPKNAGLSDHELRDPHQQARANRLISGERAGRRADAGTDGRHDSGLAVETMREPMVMVLPKIRAVKSFSVLQAATAAGEASTNGSGSISPMEPRGGSPEPSWDWPAIRAVRRAVA